MLLTPFSSQATHQTATQSSIAIDWSSGSWRRGLPRTCLSWGGVKYRVSGPTWAMTTPEQWGTNGISIVLNTWNKYMMSSSLLLSVVKWGENHFKRWPKIHQDIDSNMAVEIPKNVVAKGSQSLLKSVAFYAAATVLSSRNWPVHQAPASSPDWNNLFVNTTWQSWSLWPFYAQTDKKDSVKLLISISSFRSLLKNIQWSCWYLFHHSDL